ncbi:type VII secretion-associated serine protease mycosin [Nocardia mangyaensis]|uniref:type VII secretion-associated serine protease mycosin n=1 Tax=Nocardia mangyaensis TaxID=2213200 RepID=UPI002675C9AD|nr:type VII secretion-associated serine protease mycosin [Nocardia mangyaensis]MDO3648199.1 type VII secretion-associated serine protease mycosin [Nocardia mangyaensis]
MRRTGCAVTLAVAALLTGAAPAVAVEPPQVVVGPPPAEDPPRPEFPMKQDKGCVAAGLVSGTDPARQPPVDTALNLSRARELSRGAGVTVAVIDTGVNASPRLRDLVSGGDYVAEGGQGLSDCDAHGTLVAGIIAGTTDPSDGFTGVAPDARILSIRYRSAAFTAEDPRNFRPGEEAAVQVRTLARAIVHAARQGAGVITVALPVCVPAGAAVGQAALSEAVGYAVRVRGALVVASAGDTGSPGCNKQNPGIDPTDSVDPRGWRRVQTVSTPGWFTPDVLTVGVTTASGTALDSSLAGPWVSVAAPGTGIVSLGPGGGIVSGVGDPDALSEVGGASFATAYVSGVAALLRSRFPDETPAEIAARLQASAHSPARGVDNTVGAGLIDPMVALSYRTPPGRPEGLFQSAPLAVAPPARPRDLRPAITATAVIAGAVLLGLAASFGPGFAGIRRSGEQPSRPR